WRRALRRNRHHHRRAGGCRATQRGRQGDRAHASAKASRFRPKRHTSTSRTSALRVIRERSCILRDHTKGARGTHRRGRGRFRSQQPGGGVRPQKRSGSRGLPPRRAHECVRRRGVAMTGAAAFSAVVLAGGRSSRMGVDKATLPHPSGSTLLDRQIALLRGLGPAELLVSVRSGQDLGLLDRDVCTVRDDGTAGPLGGIVAALKAATQPRLLVVAVDLPYLDADTLRALLLVAPDRGGVPRL